MNNYPWWWEVPKFAAAFGIGWFGSEYAFHGHRLALVMMIGCAWARTHMTITEER